MVHIKKALLTLFFALAMMRPMQAFEAQEFWREPAELAFDVEVLQQGQTDDVLWWAILYTSEIYQGEEMRIFAYYARPAATGKFPAVVSIHGGGGAADWNRAVAFAQAGYACLSYDWNSWRDGNRQSFFGAGVSGTTYGNLRYEAGKSDADWGTQFFELGEDGKRPVIYRSVIAARRALSWLSARPEIDAERLAVEGHSWGGFMAQLLAGVDDRVDAVVSSAAAGAWASRYVDGEAMHLQELSPWEMFEWTRRYDPAAYATKIKAPLLLRTAGSDFFASIDTLADYWPLITSPKSLQLLAADNHTMADVATRVAWFDRWLKEAPSFPEITKVSLTSDATGQWRVRLQADGPLPITAGSAAWTTSAGPWHSRIWAQNALQPEDDGIGWATTFSPAPTGGLLRVFVSVRDEQGRVVSSMPRVLELPAAFADEDLPLSQRIVNVPIAKTDVSPLEEPSAWGKAKRIGPLAPAVEAVEGNGSTLEMLWDETAMYLRLRVLDPSPWTVAPGRTPWWQGDSVHIRLRTEDRAPEIGVPDAEQKVLYLAWHPQLNTATPGFAAQRGRGFQHEVTDTAAVTSLVMMEEDKSFTLTARLPWSFLDPNFVPQPGRTLRFALQAVHSDLLTGEGVTGIDFNRGSDFGNPERWGLATLKE